MGLLKAMAFFGGLCLFSFPPLSNCNKESKCFRENKQRGQGQEEREKERREREKEMHRKQGWMWAVEAKRWMIKDGHADKEKCNLMFLNTTGKDLLLIPAISCFLFTLRQY